MIPTPRPSDIRTAADDYANCQCPDHVRSRAIKAERAEQQRQLEDDE